MQDRTQRRYGHHVIALLGYLVLTLLLTYPMGRFFCQAIPGDGFDGWQNVWNIWWTKYALLVEGVQPYFTQMVDYPTGVYLYFHTLNIFNGLTFLPVTLNLGNLAAYNTAVAFSFIFGGYGTYLLALYIIGRASPSRSSSTAARLAAFVGGVIFAFSPYHMAHLLGHMQLISLEWLPFFALLSFQQLTKVGSTNAEGGYLFPRRKLLSRSDQRRALLASLFLILVASCDWYYAFYMALFTCLCWLWTILRRRTFVAPTLSLVVTGLVFLVLMVPLWGPMVRETLAADYMVPPAGSTERLSADLTAFFTPSPLHPWWGDWAGRWADRFTASTSERTVFAGFSVLILAVVGLVARWRKAAFWGLASLCFAILALGPVLHVAGQTKFGPIGPIPLPYSLLHCAIPLLKISRSVSRFDVVVMLCLAVLASLGLYYLLSRIKTAGAGRLVLAGSACVALLVVCVEFLAIPYPMSFPETQPFHYTLAQDKASFAIVDIPMDWDRPANLLYQTVHEKPMVSGYTSRTNPTSPAWRTPVLQTFRYLGPDINSGDPHALAPGVLRDLDVRYVIVHKTDLPPGDYREETLNLVEEVFGGLPIVVENDRLEVFTVPDKPDMAIPYLVIGEGWNPREWHDGRAQRTMPGSFATLLAYAPYSQPVRLEIEAYVTGEPGTLSIRIGDQALGEFQVYPQPTIITTPTWSAQKGETTIYIHSNSGTAHPTFTSVRLIPVEE